MNFTDADFLRGLMRQMVKDCGSQKLAASKLGFSPQYFNDAIRGKREISSDLADALGYKKVSVFVPFTEAEREKVEKR